MNNTYLVTREKDSVIVSIMLNKLDHTYSFVNFSFTVYIISQFLAKSIYEC